MKAESMRRTKSQGYGRTSRQYEIPGGDLLDSVTSILGIIAKPALINWAANVERELCLEVAQAVYDETTAGPGGLAELTSMQFALAIRERLGSQRAHQRKLVKAGDIGTEVHNRIEWEIRSIMGLEQLAPPSELSPDAAVAWAAFSTWKQDVGLVPKGIEQVVWSRMFGYAGTLDLFADVTVPVLGERTAVFDWKTGKAIYPEAKVQAAAYAHALLEMEHVKELPWGCIVRLPKLSTDPGFEVCWISPQELEKHFQGFLAAKALWDWQQGAK